MEKILKFENVSLCRNDKMIFQKMNFEIQAGQSVLLVGSSGAGKSTILQLALGLLKPTSGKIYVFDQNITSFGENKLNRIRRDFGIVFQDNALFDSLTVFENIGFFLNESFHLPQDEIQKRVMEALQFLNLKNSQNLLPSELSGGMKKRVAIARAIVTYPKIILYDEPTAGLDPLTARKVVFLIDSLQERFNVTSLIVTHEIHHFVDTVDRLLMLKNAQITYDGDPDLSILDHFEEQEPQISCNEKEENHGNV